MTRLDLSRPCRTCHALAGEPCRPIDTDTATGPETLAWRHNRGTSAPANRPDPTMTPQPNRPTEELDRP